MAHNKLFPKHLRDQMPKVKHEAILHGDPILWAKLSSSVTGTTWYLVLFDEMAEQFKGLIVDCRGTRAGYFSLAELQSPELDVTRDTYFVPKPLTAAGITLEGTVIEQVKQIPVDRLSTFTRKFHEWLPFDLNVRALNVWGRIGPYHYEKEVTTAKAWLDGFLCDLHPDREIAIWEDIADCFEEAMQQLGDQANGKKMLAGIVYLSTSPVGEIEIPGYSKELVETLRKICEPKFQGTSVVRVMQLQNGK
jgi:hypothetical protein